MVDEINALIRSAAKTDFDPDAFEADHARLEADYHCAQQVREVFQQATPAQGRHLAAHHIKRLPACPIPEIARLGANPTQVEGRLLGLL